MEADLVRTLAGTWTCSVSGDYVLRVTGPTWEGVVELDKDVDEDEYEEIAPDQPDQPDAALEVDAVEAVADQVVDLLGNARIDGLSCPTHGTLLETRNGRWTCSEGGHDLARVGQLAAR